MLKYLVIIILLIVTSVSSESSDIENNKCAILRKKYEYLDFDTRSINSWIRILKSDYKCKKYHIDLKDRKSLIECLKNEHKKSLDRE